MDRSLIVASGVALAAIGLAVMAWPSPPEPPPLQMSFQAQRQLTIHVSGAVARPGLIVLPADGRVADAIAAAGGALADGDLTVLNLAAPVADGTRIVVPAVGATATLLADGSVRINTATVAELETLPGVGPVLAARIVAYRDDNGPFSSIDDLLEVPGIGESKLGALRDAVIVP